MKRKATQLSINALWESLTYNSRVGACIYTSYGCYRGFNIETVVHKSYHAEEIALINAMLCKTNPKDIIGIVICYEFNNGVSNSIYPPCAVCRQYLWEFGNPDMIVTTVNKDGEIICEEKLKDLYPMPYPREKIKHL